MLRFFCSFSFYLLLGLSLCMSGAPPVGEATPLRLSMDHYEAKYDALGAASFKQPEGVGEWRFDERRRLEDEADGRGGGGGSGHDELRADQEQGGSLREASEEQEEDQLASWKHIFSKRGLGLLALMATTVALGVLALVYRNQLFDVFDTTSKFIREQGILGALLLTLIICITCFPPMIGYSWSLTACGYIYGWIGFVPGYIGALLGGLCSFAILRYAFRDWIEKKTRRYPKYVALERAIEKEGLPVVILIRIAPYPYPLFNALFAASRVKFHTYAIGTAVSLVKPDHDSHIGRKITLQPPPSYGWRKQRLATCISGNRAGGGYWGLHISLLPDQALPETIR